MPLAGFARAPCLAQERKSNSYFYGKAAVALAILFRLSLPLFIVHVYDSALPYLIQAMTMDAAMY